jgi:hypothetical protein
MKMLTQADLAVRALLQPISATFDGREPVSNVLTCTGVSVVAALEIN